MSCVVCMSIKLGTYSPMSHLRPSLLLLIHNLTKGMVICQLKYTNLNPYWVLCLLYLSKMDLRSIWAFISVIHDQHLKHIWICLWSILFWVACLFSLIKVNYVIAFQKIGNKSKSKKRKAKESKFIFLFVPKNLHYVDLILLAYIGNLPMAGVAFCLFHNVSISGTILSNFVMKS